MLQLSVVIPTYNRIEYIVRAITSVIKQTRPCFEIIVVDDGSTDGTSDYLRSEFLNQFPQIHLFTQNNKGVSHARNQGAIHAQGDWLAFLDSDDEWMPEKLQKQCQMLEKNPQYLISHTDEVWIRNSVRVNPMRKHKKSNGWIFEKCLPLCCVSPSSILLQKKLFFDNGGFDESLLACEDYDLWLRLFSQYPILLIDEKLVVKYGGHEDQLSKKYWGMDRFRVQSLIKLLFREQLSDQQQYLVRQQLLKKIDILLSGFRKRNKLDELQCYEQYKKKLTLL